MLTERIYLYENDDRVYIDTYVVNKNETRDAILVIPGGGYQTVCTEAEGEPIALEFVNRGYNAFVLQYRTGKDIVFPMHMQDAASAMIYIRKNAERFKINPKRVFAIGFSAGGHLCGCISTMFMCDEMKELFGEEYKLIRPTGSILSYPVTTLNADNHVSSFAYLTGKAEEDITEEDKNKFSLEKWIGPDIAPIYIWHTRTDALVDVKGTILFIDTLAKANAYYMASIFPYGPHSSDVTFAEPSAHAWRDLSEMWLRSLPDYEY